MARLFGGVARMKKLKGFTLVELVVVMAIVITMAGATLTSNNYNEKETLNNVAVKCQTLIEAARNEALAQRDPRWVTLNYFQNQVTIGKIVKIDGKDVSVPEGLPYLLPSPVIFASGGTDLYLYFDAFGELEVNNSDGWRAPLTAASAGVHTDDPAGDLTKGSLYLSFYLTNKAGTLVEEVRINPNGGSSTLVEGATLPTVPLTVVINGPSAGQSNTSYSYFSAVEGGKPPYKYAWTSGSGAPAAGTDVSFVTKWAAFDGNTKLNLTVTDSSPKPQTAQASMLIFSQAGSLTASISGPMTWDQGVDAAFTAKPAGGVPPYRYVWTCAANDATVSAGMAPTFTTQWSGPGEKTIKLIVTDSVGQVTDGLKVGEVQHSLPATWSTIVYPLPTVTITGPTAGKLTTDYLYTCTPVGGSRGFTYAWSGGETPATGTASGFTTHWATTGTKTVSLTITDSAGQSASSAAWPVIIYAAPTVAISVGPGNGKLATDYTYTPTVTGGLAPYTYAWSGGGTLATGTASSFTTHWAAAGPKTLTLTVTDSLAQTATLTPYNVTLYAAPTGTVSGLSSCFVGVAYTCTASFSGGMGPLTYAWTGGETPATGATNPFITQWSTPNTYTLKVTVTDALGQTGAANMNVLVTQRLLTYIINPVGVGGTVTLNPAGGAYAAGTVVTLTESPAAAYTFSSWGGDASGSGATTTITMTGNKAVTANFTLKTFTLTYTAGANGTISGASPQTVAYGTAGTAVTAKANTNYNFVAWSDGVATAIRTDSNVITAIAVTANFTLNQFLVTFKNWDGTTLGTPSYVIYGNAATAPGQPTKTGYTFAGWDRALTNITAITTITATFTANVSGAITIAAGTNLWRQATSNTDFDGRGNGVISATNSGGAITYEYAYNQNLTWTYHGQGLAMVSGSQYYASMDVYISPDANIPATGTTWVADIEGGCGGGFFYDNTQKGTWQRLTIVQTATAASGAMYLYPSTSVIYATTGVVRYKNVVFSSWLSLGTTTLTYAGSAVPITATPIVGYNFVNWAVTVNPSYVSIANAGAAATTISATSSMPQGGVATVTAIFNSNVSGTIVIAAGTGGSVGGGGTNLFGGYGPGANNGGTVTDVTASVPSPVPGSNVWDLVKTGSGNQWHGWESTYGGVFNSIAGDVWLVSGYYKTTATAGAALSGVWFYASDWSRALACTTMGSSGGSPLIADGQWHYFYRLTRIDETYASPLIADGPSWGYSTQTGELFITGMLWEKVAPTPTTLAYKGSAAAITATPNAGYHFVSWAGTDNPSYISIANAGATATTIAATSSLPQGGTATVTATFVADQYTVTFVDWNGTVLKTQANIVYGGAATPPASPGGAGNGITVGIGSSFQGGKVAYIYGCFAGWSGTYTNITSTRTITATYTQHGLIAATADQGPRDAFGGQSGLRMNDPNGTWQFPTTTLTSAVIGTGLANTNYLIAQYGAANVAAAALARNYTGGGYTDWYLPSRDELNQLYINKGAIGGFTTEYEAGETYYWSSTESRDLGTPSNLFMSCEWAQVFKSGATSGQQFEAGKSYNWAIRPVRSF